MNTRRMTKRMLGAALAAAVLIGLMAVPRALARIVSNTIDAAGTIADHGRQVVLTGPLQCTQVEWVDLRVTVTQRTTGAVAEGRVRLRGGTAVQEWAVAAATQGSAAFEAGPATAVAIAVTSAKGEVTDAHQWLVGVMLEE